MRINSASRVEALLDELDQLVSYRVYVTSASGSEPTEVATRVDFRMLPSQLKIIAWFLVIRDPVEITFEAHTRVSMLLDTSDFDNQECFSKTRVHQIVAQRTSKSRRMLERSMTSGRRDSSSVYSR